MKWVFYVIVFIYMFYRAVYGAKTKEVFGVSIEPVKYDADKNYLVPGVRKTISCIGSSKNQKVEWIDPAGNTVKRVPTNRVFVQENFVPRHRTRVPALVLVFTSVVVEDSGVWECRSGLTKQKVSLCVIDPSQFVDTTPTVVTVDSGRSITLSCQVKGDPRVLWYRNGDILIDDVNSSKYQVMTKYNSQGFEGLLTITSVEPEDSGIYNCESIQESPFVDDCIYRQSINISLQVNHAPMFRDGNETTIIYGTDGESLELICSASGFPTPTYRWFKKIDDTLTEYAPDKIKLLDDGAEALLTLTSSSYSWDQRFMCRATNQYGDVDKSFLLVKTEIPTEPSEIKAYSESEDKLQFELIWDTGMIFPVKSIDIQYLEVKSLNRRRVKESDWIRSKHAEMKTDDMDTEGLNVTLSGLEEETKYWIRMRAVNSAGRAQWSKPILASTLAKSDVPEESEESNAAEGTEVTVSPPEAAKMYSDSTFYGLFFAGGILVIAVATMFLIRLV